MNAQKQLTWQEKHEHEEAVWQQIAIFAERVGNYCNVTLDMTANRDARIALGAIGEIYRHASELHNYGLTLSEALALNGRKAA